MSQVIERFVDALLSMNRLKARNLVYGEHDGVDPFSVIESLVVPALEVIGDGWSRGTLALSQVYISSRIVEELIDELLPPEDPARIGQPRMAIAVLEDYHLLGKRIIYSVLRASGYTLLDYGRVTVGELLEKIIADEIEILLISTLMLPSALRIKDLKKEIDRKQLKVRLIVGGAPFRFDSQLCHDVEADATAGNAAEALRVLNQVVRELS